MTQSNADPVILNVHLAGPIAYVPDNDGSLWALIPNALTPTRASWRPKEDYLTSRSSHMALLIFDDAVFDRYRSTARTTTTYNREVPESGPFLFPLTAGAKTATLVFGAEIEFEQPNGEIVEDEDIQYVPRIKEISKRHSYVARKFHPRDQNFQPDALSAAFQIRSGQLTVGSYFGQADPSLKPSEVEFGYVTWGPNEPFPSRVWKKPVANHLIWKIKYEPSKQEIKVKIKQWGSADEPTEYWLTVPSSKTIDMAIIHSEPELPFLFLTDPALPETIKRFPDPDFEILYAISANQRKRWRVPIDPGGPSGAEEKTCANGYFEGFK